MSWQAFPWFAGAAVLCWGLGFGSTWLFRKRTTMAPLSLGLFLAGSLVVAGFIVLLWLSLERPPLRTVGETRLWYAALLPWVGIYALLRWKLRWLLYFCLSMATLFLWIVVSHPEAYDKTLMPALQSLWFVPHVVVYMVGYALMAAAALVAIHGLWPAHSASLVTQDSQVADQLVQVGFAFISIGILFGAFWAKTAWGHYWTWDPKETWAFLTWSVYLIYIHFRVRHPEQHRVGHWFLVIAFITLLICWLGLEYLPSAQFSTHTYSG